MNKFLACVLACLAISSFGAVPSVDESFDAGRYSIGFVFPSATDTNGWQSSGTAAFVTNDGVFSGQSVFMGEAVALTNTLTAPDANLKVWTDFRIWPMLGVEPTSPPTNGSSFLCYFSTGGYVVAWNTSSNNWVTLTNDIWGNSLTPVTNSTTPASNNYARLSVFQDFSNRVQAIFLNDQLIQQDLNFVCTTDRFSQLVVQNTDSNCWIDNVFIKTNTPGDLIGNRNGDGILDAVELVTYGYASRTQYVSSATGYPRYATIQAAVNAWRPRDTIKVLDYSYIAEAVTISSNISFVGNAFSVSNLTIAAGANVAFAQAVTCSNALTVASGATGTFNNAIACGSVSVATGGKLTAAGVVTCGGTMMVASGASATFSSSVTSSTLLLTGTVTMASAQNFTSTTATVVGNIGFTGGGTFVVTDASSGALAVSGQVTFTNSHLVATGAGVDMNGTFTISNTWSAVGAVAMPLPFEDNFDLYGESNAVNKLKFRGWYASDGTVVVQSSIKNSGKNAVVLPDGTVMSNLISAASATNKVWTDYFIRPAWGVEPASPATGSSSFLAYVNTNGNLVVNTNGSGWVACTSKVGSGASEDVKLSSNAFTRVTVCQDLQLGTFSVFIASNLVAQGLSSPTKLANYTSFVADNKDAGLAAYLDDVLIRTTVPDGLGSDLDGDGLADAYEVNSYGLISAQPNGTAFKLR